MKKLIILLTLVSFIQPLDLLAKERSEHREKKSQQHSRQSKPSKAQINRQSKPSKAQINRQSKPSKTQISRQKQVRQKNHSKNENASRRQNVSENIQHRQATVLSRNKPSKHEKKYNRTNRHSGRHIVDRTNNKPYGSVKNRREFINKQKHRRHNIVYRDQHRRYNYDHYRGSHQYGKWHVGHGHHHYDYRYRYTYNPYQWYDNYYYQSYFDWRWGRTSYGSYSYDYYDPYYCPDGFTEFVAGLAVGALIYNW